MSMLSPSTEVNSSHNNLDDNYFTYASTYNYGKFGTKKMTEESFKSNSITGNKIIIQPCPINNITNSNTNNTNSNTNSNTNNNITNSNTNNNRSKNRDIQACKKKLKNYHSVSPNIILVQSSSNAKFYKNKSNKRLSKITKNNLKTSITHIKLSKKEFSKSSSNFHVFTNINKNKNIKYLQKKTYSKKKIKSKSLNKFSKDRKELNHTNGLIKPRFNYSSCLFSSMASNLINRQKNKYSISNKVIKDINNNINSYKRDISNIYKNKKNLSTNELNLNSMKFILNEDINSDNTNNISKKYNNKDESNVEDNHRQITEENVNYLRVRKRSDLQNNLNFHNKDILKIESTPLLSNNTKIKLSSPSSFIFNETSAKNINNKEINLTENIKNNTYLNANNSTEECVFNIIEYQKISKLNFENEIKSHNSNELIPEEAKNQRNKQNSITDINDNNKEYNHFNIDINISQSNNKNESKISEKNKDKDTKNKQEKKSIKKNDSNKNHTNNIYNTKKSKSKKNEFIKSKTNDSSFIPFKNKSNNNNITYISNMNNIKKIKTEDKIKKIDMNKNPRNKKKYFSNSKNNFGNKTRKNYSLKSNKIHLSKKKYQNSIKKQYSNRNKSFKNKSYNNKMSLNKKINKNNKNDIQTKIKEKEKKEPYDIESPEELHYFMVNLSIEYKHLNDNF